VDRDFGRIIAVLSEGCGEGGDVAWKLHVLGLGRLISATYDGGTAICRRKGVTNSDKSIT
jgi:hypothetical protein